jgi:hypothetical protein
VTHLSRNLYGLENRRSLELQLSAGRPDGMVEDEGRYAEKARKCGPSLVCRATSGRLRPSCAVYISWTMTFPPVILGGFGSAPSSFSSRSHSATTRVDSSACAEVS